MIQFNRRCEICGKPTSDLYNDMVDGHILCITHFRLALESGMLSEGLDDEWHFNNSNDFETLKLL